MIGRHDGKSMRQLVALQPKSGRDECWYLPLCLLSTQSETLAHGMVLPNLGLTFLPHLNLSGVSSWACLEVCLLGGPNLAKSAR